MFDRAFIRAAVRLTGVLVLQAALVSQASGGPVRPGFTAESLSVTSLRDNDPVTVPGSSLPDLQDQQVDHLALFRYDSATSSFLPIPFQIDERVDHVFNPGTPLQFMETIYDVMDEDDGVFDQNDEIAFIFSDSGQKAPPEATWLPGSLPIRFEVAISDPRPGATAPQRWVYIYAGEDLPRSTEQYVSWNTSPSGTIIARDFSLTYQDRWLLTEYSVTAPCGVGLDIIDRFKGRAGLAPHMGETEELWNSMSSFLGGLAGPVRAIRSVLGAASAVNTTHHDIVYGYSWVRRYNLRVHPLNQAWFYIDCLPASGTMILTSENPNGLPVDGVPDAGVSPTLPDWSILRGPDGGFVILPDVPPSPLYGASGFYHRDDATYDDAPASEPDYSDEDDSAYGNHGFFLADIGDTNTTAIASSLVVYPLCADEGDPALGSAYAELKQWPLSTSAIVQWTSGGPVRTLIAQIDAEDILLDWEDLPSVSGYRVYTSPDPASPFENWALLAETVDSLFRHAGAGSGLQDHYYSVVSLTPAGEGPR